MSRYRIILGKSSRVTSRAAQPDPPPGADEHAVKGQEAAAQLPEFLFSFKARGGATPSVTGSKRTVPPCPPIPHCLPATGSPQELHLPRRQVLAECPTHTLPPFTEPNLYNHTVVQATGPPREPGGEADGSLAYGAHRAEDYRAVTQESGAALLGSKTSAKHVSWDPVFQYQLCQYPKCWY